MRVSDRNLLVKEIERKLKCNDPTKEDIVAKIIKKYKLEDLYKEMEILENIEKDLDDAKNINYKNKKFLLEKACNKMGLIDSFVTDHPSMYDFNNKAIRVYREENPIPSRQEIETAIFFANDGEDMTKLLNKVLKQFKK